VGAFVFLVGSTTFGRRYMWELWYILCMMTTFGGRYMWEFWYILLARLNCIMVENLEP
jgi:hypothetical protein